jgi:hypothetical protein
VAIKLFSLFAAIVIWFYVNHAIVEKKIFTKVPIRVVNIPQGKTMRGLLLNNMLDQKLTLSLTGSRDALDRLDSRDLEVVVDCADKGNEWILHVEKKNLVSLNPDVDLMKSVSSVSHNEMIMKLSPLVVDKIPIYITTPTGEPPEGYQFLDIYPREVFHTLSGPEEDIKALKAQGIELTFDLSSITKGELDFLKSEDMMQADEVSFVVPDSWKQIQIPFLQGMKQEINGNDAKLLRIHFLRKSVLPYDQNLLIRAFYPLTTSEHINPMTHPLQGNDWIVSELGLYRIVKPLFVSEVSRLFLDVVRDYLEIIVVASPSDASKHLSWEVNFIDPQHLEEQYIAKVLGSEDVFKDRHKFAAGSQKVYLEQRKEFLRGRFREYMQKLRLLRSKTEPFDLKATLDPHAIIVEDVK